jgi:tetratricopeptide (TPR) repeat protein
MIRHFFFSFFILLVAATGARDKPEDWLEIRSAHFVVVSNANPKQAQNVADQFERMRALFQKALPRLEPDAGSPITVIAVKNEKDFRALEPEEYVAKGQLKLAGYFLRASDNNFVLVRTDAEGDHPYSVVYHEYTHFVTRKAGEWMPLWLNEGLAEFYQNTDIRDKDPVLGQPSRENILLLRQARLLPLATLFTVDHSSPYYHEENKGSIFYAESWALTHYLMMKDFREKTTKLRDYAELVSQKVDPVKAATLAFGDLTELQKALDSYVRQPVFTQLKIRGTLTVADLDYKVRPLTFAEAAAVRAEFLAYINRSADALALAEAVLKEDPNSALGHEVMGYLKFRQGDMAEARKWYGKAVKLDSQSFLAHYYFASIAMSTGQVEPEDDAQVESSLRTAIRLNPQFAPAYDRLGVFFGMRQKNLGEAHILALQALTIDPSNVAYWLNDAMILRTGRREQDAIRVMRNALKVAQSSAEMEQVQNALQMAEQYEAAQKSYEEGSRRASEEESAAKLTPAADKETGKMEETAPPVLQHRSEGAPQGPRRTSIGTIKNVQCSSPARMEFELQAEHGPVALHADNYYKIQFSTLGFNPKGELHPCSDLEGMSARVEFMEVSGKPGQITAVELRK